MMKQLLSGQQLLPVHNTPRAVRHAADHDIAAHIALVIIEDLQPLSFARAAGMRTLMAYTLNRAFAPPSDPTIYEILEKVYSLFFPRSPRATSSHFTGSGSRKFVNVFA